MRTSFSAFLVCLFTLTLSLPAVAAEDRKENCLLIENAQIKLPEKFDDPTFGHANYGHEIQAGKNNVILVREVWGLLAVIDAQYFKKTTLEYKPEQIDFVPGHAKTIDILRSYYSIGNSGFVASKHYSWAKDVTKKASITQELDGLKLTIDTRFPSTFMLDHKKNSTHLAVSCVLHKMSFDEFKTQAGETGTDSSSFYSVDK